MGNHSRMQTSSGLRTDKPRDGNAPLWYDTVLLCNGQCQVDGSNRPASRHAPRATWAERRVGRPRGPERQNSPGGLVKKVGPGPRLMSSPKHPQAIEPSIPRGVPRSQLAVGRNQWYNFGVGEFTTHVSVYFSGDWDVHWGYGTLTHGQLPKGVGNKHASLTFGATTKNGPKVSVQARGWDCKWTTGRCSLGCCWVGSLNFNFLGKQVGISTEPAKS